METCHSKGTEHRAQGSGLRAQGSGHRAKGMGQRAQGQERRDNRIYSREDEPGILNLVFRHIQLKKN